MNQLVERQFISFPVQPRSPFFAALAAYYEQQEVLISETSRLADQQADVARQLELTRQQTPTAQDVLEINLKSLKGLTDAVVKLPGRTEQSTLPQVPAAYSIYIAGFNANGWIDRRTLVGRWLVETGSVLERDFESLEDIVKFVDTVTASGAARKSARSASSNRFVDTAQKLLGTDPFNRSMLLQNVERRDLFDFLQLASEMLSLFRENTLEAAEPSPQGAG